MADYRQALDRIEVRSCIRVCRLPWLAGPNDNAMHQGEMQCVHTHLGTCPEGTGIRVPFYPGHTSAYYRYVTCIFDFPRKAFFSQILANHCFVCDFTLSHWCRNPVDGGVDDHILTHAAWKDGQIHQVYQSRSCIMLPFMPFTILLSCTCSAVVSQAPGGTPSLRTQSPVTEAAMQVIYH